MFIPDPGFRVKRHLIPDPVLRIRIHMFLGILDPDPPVRGTDPDPDPSVIMQK
jgi:hypothetical protein